ncbi:MAG TPA: hypothetical protein VGL15_15680, partial [Vicinamibacteria bacterium]
MNIKFPSHLTTNELMADMNRHARSERENVACLIADIAEFDARDGHLAAGYSSLYLYCREVLKLTEFEAYLRIEVARLARRFPIILEKLAEGSLHLTTVRLLAPQLRPDNHQELLDEASGKSTREVKGCSSRRTAARTTS